MFSADGDILWVSGVHGVLMEKEPFCKPEGSIGNSLTPMCKAF